ncbi:MAG: hypothetical protein Q4C03_05330, partial [bacterium]|nr:hypothetical protein [bacterium]
MNRDLEARAIATEERRFKENLEALKAQDATAAVGILKTLVDLLGQRLSQAEADYLSAVQSAVLDGEISSAEET